MKVFNTILKTLLLIVGLAMFTNLQTGCKDPDEYAPHPDSLISPPAAPQLLNPPHDTGWVYVPAQGPVIVNFEWTSVQGAEYYELHVYADTTYTDPVTYKVSYNAVIIAFLPRPVYWRVRASSSRWTWYTDWSEIRYFRVWWPVE